MTTYVIICTIIGVIGFIAGQLFERRYWKAAMRNMDKYFK